MIRAAFSWAAKAHDLDSPPVLHRRLRDVPRCLESKQYETQRVRPRSSGRRRRRKDTGGWLQTRYVMAARDTGGRSEDSRLCEAGQMSHETDASNAVRTSSKPCRPA